MRLDKWLKVSRLIKRRTVANEACDNQRMSANGRPVKASYEVKPGDVLELRFGERITRVEVLAVTDKRGEETTPPPCTGSWPEARRCHEVRRSCPVTDWLVKTFITDPDDWEDPAVRERYGLLSGWWASCSTCSSRRGSCWRACSPAPSPSPPTPSTTCRTRAPRW